MRTRRLLLWLLCAGSAFALGAVLDRRLPRSAEAVEASLRDSLREPDPLARVSQLARASSRVRAQNTSAVRKLLESEPPGELESRMLAHAWGRADTANALRDAQSLTPQRSGLLEEIAYASALRDPDATLDALRTSRALERRLATMLVRGWAQTPDFRSATGYVESVEDPGVQQQLMGWIALARLERDGPEAVFRWAEEISEDAPHRFKRLAHREAARVVAQADPKRAAAWVEASTGRPYATGTVRIVATKWVEADPDAAFAWLLSQPAGPERDQAMKMAFHRWFNRDVKAAGAWLTKAPPGPALDPAIGIYAPWLALESPEEALAWARRIENPALRIRCLIRVGQVWLTVDPVAARAWLAEADLPAEVKATIDTPARPPAKSAVRG